MANYEDIAQIKQLKYKYFRCLDSKRWQEMTSCFVDEATAAYDSGKYSYEGRDAILSFLEGALGNPEIISMHHGHHPEIELVSDTEAVGTWYLEDYVIFKETSLRLRGAAFYRDTYTKVDGEWKIVHTGYVRTFEEIHDGGTASSWQITSSGNHLGQQGAAA